MVDNVKVDIAGFQLKYVVWLPVVWPVSALRYLTDSAFYYLSQYSSLFIHLHSPILIHLHVLISILPSIYQSHYAFQYSPLFISLPALTLCISIFPSIYQSPCTHTTLCISIFPSIYPSPCTCSMYFQYSPLFISLPALLTLCISIFYQSPCTHSMHFNIPLYLSVSLHSLYAFQYSPLFISLPALLTLCISIFPSIYPSP